LARGAGYREVLSELLALKQGEERLQAAMSSLAIPTVKEHFHPPDAGVSACHTKNLGMPRYRTPNPLSEPIADPRLLC
jgi:hypothetical protein